MGPKALQAGNGVIQVGERLIGIEALVVKRYPGPGHMVGGLGAELRQAGCFLMRLTGDRLPFRRHGDPPYPFTRGPFCRPQAFSSQAIRVKASLNVATGPCRLARQGLVLTPTAAKD